MAVDSERLHRVLERMEARTEPVTVRAAILEPQLR